MGCCGLQVCPWLPRDNGVVPMEDLLFTSTLSFQSSSSLTARENWEIAERRTDEILCRIRPTLLADQNRREVIKYVRDLITASLGCEVFPYGSVPLKTYLPDGDIDLTAISNPNLGESLVSDVYAVLKGEEHNKSARFEVKDVHCIDAEVKLVKCLVDNIVVDISFNQLGGLCTLCFLEEVDGLIGKDHLFKRSIILIKAWCYYESRILGAHHGLISTYALETLVLYIFHLFHSSLDGPLAVLYQFLNYFVKFDWENYCVSLSGPVCKSCLPDTAAKLPENGRDNLLLSEEFLQECADKFSVPSRGMETNSQAFPQKHLNIIDALKENNNLGRSVNRGNFYRICSAFKYGARKLGEILMLPSERLVDELNKFFGNTLERHESEFSTDVQEFASSSDYSSSTQHSETCHEDIMFLKSSSAGCSCKIARFRNDLKRHSSKGVSSLALPELNCTSDRNAVSGRCLARDAKEVVATGILSSRNRNDLSSSLPFSSAVGTFPSGKSYHAPPCCNGKIDNRKPHGRMPSKSFSNGDISFALWPEYKENNLVASSSLCSCINDENKALKSLSLSASVSSVSENSSSALRERNSGSILGSSEPSKSLLDLSGHYESYFSNLMYGKCYYVSAPVLLSPPMSNRLQNKNFWGTICQSQELDSEVSSKMITSGCLGPQFYSVDTSMLSNTASIPEEKKKSRGTGTYFPKMNYLSTMGRPLLGRERFRVLETHGQLQRYAHKNGSASAPMMMNSCGEGSHELSEEEYPVLGNRKSTFSDLYRPPSVWVSSKASDLSHSLERQDSGSYGLQLREVPLREVSTQPATDTSHAWDSASSLLVAVAQGPNLVVEINQDRATDQSYHLTNEADFPPLSL